MSSVIESQVTSGKTKERNVVTTYYVEQIRSRAFVFTVTFVRDVTRQYIISESNLKVYNMTEMHLNASS